MADVIALHQLCDGVDPPSSPPIADSVEETLKRFHHFTSPTLSHLLAILCHSSPSFPPAGTDVIVIDSVSTLFAAAYPSNTASYANNPPPGKRTAAVQWASNRRWSVLADFTASLSKLASSRHLAVLILSQVNTRLRKGHQALLRPAMYTKSWTKSIDTRIVLFRDWLQPLNGSSDQDTSIGVRFAALAKHRTVSYAHLENVVAFRIGKVVRSTFS